MHIFFLCYYLGGQGIVWYLCWIYFSYEEPSDHPNISKTELELIGKHWEKTVFFKNHLNYKLTRISYACIVYNISHI